MTDRQKPAFLFDMDGTLVDSVYQHVLAWREALDEEGIDLSVWRIHRKIGMSGGLFANALLRATGMEMQPELLERLRRRHAEAFRRRISEVRPLPETVESLLPVLGDVDLVTGSPELARCHHARRRFVVDE